MRNEDRLERYIRAAAPLHAADPLGYQARYLFGLVVQAKLRMPKRTAKVLQLRGRKNG